MEVNFAKTGITNAIRRAFPNIASQVLDGTSSFEDQLILDTEGVQVNIFKKISDVVGADGIIKPKLIPYAIVKNCLIESDSFDISEGSIAGHSQSFKYLVPLTTSNDQIVPTASRSNGQIVPTASRSSLNSGAGRSFKS